MNIAGIGIVSNRGRGIQSLERALEEGWIVPKDSSYRVAEDIIKDKTILKEARRADNFTKMAVLAGYDAFVDSGLPPEAKKTLGIIVATAFGPHVTTFRFIDDILSYTDANVSPTIFSHSVHNAAASYLSFALESRGPTLTITQFADSFYQAVALAQSWLDENRCDYILVGSVDQYGEVMKYICGQKLKISQDGKIRPFYFSKLPEAVPGEGSVFFLMTNQPTPGKYASLFPIPDKNSKKPDMYILDCDGMNGNEEVYLPIKETGALVSSYTPVFGSMLTVTGFNCAVAALMLKKQYSYAAPVQDNPHELNLCKTSRPAKIDAINCVKYGCKKEKQEIFLER